MNQYEPRRPSGPQSGGEEPPIPGLSALKRECAPERDLWTGIDSRIRAQRIRRQRAPWMIAVGVAACLVVVLSASIGMQRLDGKRADPLRAPVEMARLGMASDSASLLPATNRMHPETRALVKANLKIVDNAENQLRRAMAADPDDAYLRSLLSTARQQKEQLHVVLADAR